MEITSLSTDKETIRIAVIGDINVDTVVVPLQQLGGTTGEPQGGGRDGLQYRRFRREGGAWILAKMMKSALGERDTDTITYTYDEDKAKKFCEMLDPPCPVSLAVLAALWQGRDNKDLVYRLERGGVLGSIRSESVPQLQLMAWGDASGVPTSGNNLVIVGTDNKDQLRIRIFDANGKATDTEEENLRGVQAEVISALKQQLPSLLHRDVLTGAERADLLAEVISIVGQIPGYEKTCLLGLLEQLRVTMELVQGGNKWPHLVVIHDQNAGFRNLDAEDSILPFLKENPHFKPEAAGKDSGWIILKMSNPLAQGKLWEAIERDFADRAVIVTSAENLRQEGVNMRDDSSFEQTGYRFMAYLRESNIISRLSRCHHLIVRFDNGIFHYDSKSKKMSVHFHPNPLEGSMTLPSTLGRMTGYTSVVVAAIVKGIAWAIEMKQSVDNGIRHGSLLGIVLAGRLFRNGFAKVGFEGNPEPYESLFKNWDAAKSEEETIKTTSIELPETLTQYKEWSRVDGYCKNWSDVKISEYPKHAAMDVVLRGLENVVIRAVDRRAADHVYPEWATHSTITIPYAQFGDIKSIDREEIDSFSSIQTLMENYRDRKDWRYPLSIAVFGPPGSGKSTTVRNILRTVDPRAAERPLEFNVAQFSNVSDLAIACHQAQDRALAGEVPLVSFDEFDTAFNKERLGWLQYFLAPMQDGLFKAGERMYRIGRAIFLFSGGTAHSFNQFRTQQDETLFRAAKGPDFVSRLRGHLNIKGIDGADSVSDVLMFRRAILLRFFLEKNLKQIIDKNTMTARIDRGVVWAFLRIAQYKHGVRSMEAIVQMASISQSRQSFQKASVPPLSQLEMHVDAKEFLNLMNSK